MDVRGQRDAAGLGCQAECADHAQRVAQPSGNEHAAFAIRYCQFNLATQRLRRVVKLSGGGGEKKIHFSQELRSRIRTAGTP